MKVNGKPQSMRFIKSPKKGTEGIEIAFAVLGNDGKENYVIWTGWLTVDTVERTKDSMMICGWNKDMTTNSDGVFTHPNALNKVDPVSLTLETENYTNEKGEARSKTKVAFINRLGGGGYAGVTPEEVRSSVGMNLLKASLLASGQGIKNHAPQAVQPSFESQEVMPF